MSNSPASKALHFCRCRTRADLQFNIKATSGLRSGHKAAKLQRCCAAAPCRSGELTFSQLPRRDVVAYQSMITKCRFGLIRCTTSNCRAPAHPAPLEQAYMVMRSAASLTPRPSIVYGLGCPPLRGGVWGPSSLCSVVVGFGFS